MRDLLNGHVADADARRFLEDLFTSLEFLDDAIDGDAGDGPAPLGIVETIFHDIPANRFFRENCGVLLPVMRAAISDWRTATEIEIRSRRFSTDVPDVEALRSAWFLRASYLDLAAVVVDLVSGPVARDAFRVKWAAVSRADQPFENYVEKVTSPLRPDKRETDPLAPGREWLFATPVFTRHCDLDLGPVADFVNALMLDDPEGISRSNSGGGWHSSRSDLHLHDVFSHLRSRIVSEMWSIAEDLDYSRSFPFEITGMWANVGGPGAFNRVHVHPQSLWSGVFYLKTPENCGKIGFQDPRPQALIMQPVVEDSKRVDKRIKPVISFEVMENMMILFPGYLPHEVDVNRSGDTRMSIAFNVSQSTGLGTDAKGSV